MADEYTPTTGQRETDIRNVYALFFGDGDLDRGYQNFDAWLAARDREVAAKALREFAKKVYNGAPASRDANFQAFYNEGLHPVLMAEADRIERGASDGEQ